jgi:hypothetical protein
VVIRVVPLRWKVICPTNGELARYEYDAVFVPSDTDAGREALSY